MPVSQSQIDSLNAAISLGERVVRKGDRMIEYRSVAEMIRARDDLVAQMAAETVASGGRPRPRQTKLYQSGRGFHNG
ncbi:MAG: hypothetical protein ABIG70_03015 [Pseudomonadota bacterium]